jgi:hypothetical protein
MNRSKFLWLSFTGSISLYLPLHSCSSKKYADKAWVRPVVLSKICDDNMIRDIGKDYYQKFSNKADQENIADQIFAPRVSRDIISTKHTQELIYQIDQKIKQDFEAGRIVVLKGWILSQTEALQCALFHLI